MRSLVQYFRERFPIAPVLTYALGYAGLVIGTQSSLANWQNLPMELTRQLLTVMAIFILFFLRQRVVDEFRDYEHDSKHFPNRPLQRGLVTKKQIVVVGVLALLAELLLVSTTAPLYLYIPVFLFTILMAKDFFIKSWLASHFTTHFFLHEIFFVLFGGYFVTSLFSQRFSLVSSLTVLVLAAAPISIELIRKFKPRFDPRGKPVDDSYSIVWGRYWTLIFLAALICITGLGLSFIKWNVAPICLAVLWIMLLWAHRKSDKFVVTIGILQYCTYSFLAIII